jgi:tripartite-type tricarboxylate transporter receptor subunit TctC
MGKLSAVAGVLLVAVSMAFVPSLAHGQSPDEFYRNARISLIIGFNAGGPYDAYARLAAAMLPRYIPGSPVIVARNMPGGGSVKAANFLFHQASRDGLTIGMTGQQLAASQALRDPHIDFDLRRFHWLGRFNLGATAASVAWHTSRVKTIEDAKKIELTLAATGAASTSVSLPLIMNRLIGTRFRLIRGYSGVNGTVLAMERGETEGAHATTEQLLTSKPDWLRDKKVSVLVQYALQRHPAFADVPAMVEFGTTAQDRQVLAIFGSEPELGRSIMMPPGVPAERVAILRKAFAAMIADPSFKHELLKRNLGFDPRSGAVVQKMIEETLNISPEVAARAVELSKVE